MRYDPVRHHRRSIRLRGHDYSRGGAYFVTVCAKNRECLFGDIVDGDARLNDAGRIVQNTWDSLPSHYAGVQIDEFVVMPNHVHGIIVLNDRDVGAPFMAPNDCAIKPGAMTPNATLRGAMNRAPTLGEIVRGFKARATAAINRERQSPGVPVWQRNYYEHIIRNDESLNRIRQYIIENPARWAFDRENAEGGRTLVELAEEASLR